MTSSDLIAVTGATGRQGGAVARRLLGQGRAVRALTRRPDSDAARALGDRGAELVACDLDDPSQVREALGGAQGVFLTTTPYEEGVDTEERQALGVIDAAVATGVHHVVYSSVASADLPTGVPHFESKGRVEQHLAAAGIEVTTVLRPTLFMEMFLGESFRRAVADGQIEFALHPDTSIAFVAVDDIAAFAAAAFNRPDEFDTAVIELVSARRSMQEVADDLAAALGRPIGYSRVDPAGLGEDVRPKVGTQQWLESVGWPGGPEDLERWAVPVTSVRRWAEQHRSILLELRAGDAS